MRIDGDRVFLREWQYSDIADLIQGLNNINVSKWMASVPFPYTKNDAISFIERAKEANDVSNGFRFAIVLKENEKVIGGTELIRINEKDGTAGGGIWINEIYQGKGFGTEAFKLKIKYGFEKLNLRKMENGYFPGNEFSKHMQEKLGYKQEGIRRKHFYCLATGEYVDEVITGLFREDFAREIYGDEK